MRNQRNHKVSGKKAIIELEYVRRGCTYSTPSRVRYLRQQVAQFREWLTQQGVEEIDSLFASIKEAHFQDSKKGADVGALNVSIEEWIQEDAQADSFDVLCHTMAHKGCDCEEEDECGHEEPECTCTQRSDDPSDWFAIHGQEYHGMLHDVAKKGYKKAMMEESRESVILFQKGVEFLDKLEENYNLKLPVGKRLNAAWANKAKLFRERLNKMFHIRQALTYQQWAYLSNWLNVLTNYRHMDGDLKGEIKQYPCKAQGILVDANEEIEVDPYSVELLYHSTDYQDLSEVQE